MTLHMRLGACEQAYIAFTAGLEPYRSILAALATPETGFTHEQYEDTQRVLFACHSILDPVIDPLPPPLILSLLSDLHGGHGPWLLNLQRAIEETPFETDAEQRVFLAAFHMASSLIYHLHPKSSDRQT